MLFRSPCDIGLAGIGPLGKNARPRSDPGPSLFMQGTHYPVTHLLEEAVDTVRRMPADAQDDIARAMLEGMMCGLADAVQSLVKHGVAVRRILLIGGAAKNPAVVEIASAILGREILLPPVREYVADGAALQAAWVLLGKKPEWDLGSLKQIQATPTPEVLERYRNLRDRTESWGK